MIVSTVTIASSRAQPPASEGASNVPHTCVQPQRFSCSRSNWLYVRLTFFVRLPSRFAFNRARFCDGKRYLQTCLQLPAAYAAYAFSALPRARSCA